jgi:hypothetical protein
MMVVPVINEILTELQEVTDQHLRRCERAFRDPSDGEEVLGTLFREETRRLFALAFIYDARAAGVAVECRMKSDSREDDEAADVAEHRLRQLRDTAETLFETQARDDIGGKAWRGKLAVRSGWVLVVPADPSQVIVAAIRKAAEE